MSLQEFCRILKLSETTVKTNFNRTRERLLNYGISIYKEGYGKKTEYFIEELNQGSINNYVKHYKRS